MPVTILYEDQRGQRNDFGLHDFVCQCVIDRASLTLDLYQVRKTLIQGNPLKGNGNLRRSCQRDLPRLASQFRKVFAVYDEDRIPQLLNLHAPTCRRLLCQQLMAGCDPTDSLEVVLLRRNIESVIETIRDSGLISISASIFAEALGKRHLMRDRVFTRCAIETTPENRAKLLGQLPDLLRLVARVTEHVSSPSPEVLP